MEKGTRRKLRKRLKAAAFALLASALSLLLYWQAPVIIEGLDARGRDVVFQLRDSPPPHSAVAIVAIDEKSVKQFGRWPWPRELQAQLIRKLKQLNPAVIALDIDYVVSQDRESDADLANALAAGEVPVIGGYYFRDEQSVPVNSKTMKQWQASGIRITRRLPGANRSGILSFPHVEPNQSDIGSALATQGFFNSVADQDGIIRHAPLVITHGGRYYPSLSLAALSRATGQDIRLTIGPGGIDSLQLENSVIPVDQRGMLALNLYSPSADTPLISAADILDGSVNGERIADRLILVGVTEVSIADVVPTPLDSAYPGVSIHATAASNILQEHFLYSGEHAIPANVAMIALLPLMLVGLMVISNRSAWIILSAILTITAALAMFVYFVIVKGLLVSLIYPILALFIGFLVFQVHYAMASQNTTRFLTRAFSSYVSPAVVQQLIDDPDRLELGGERREITVLFSDIRSFTTISESMTPEALVEMLNSYLGSMTDIIMSREGTLDKYIGDAVMAFFNAPLKVPDHPCRAADAALAMKEVLAGLNVGFARRYGQQFEIGIGLHTGEAVVGNLGASHRFDYTAVGDTVNLGARLESATKHYKAGILISETTRAALDDRFVCRLMDRIQVKGKTRAVEIHELLARPGKVHACDLADQFTAAMHDYFGGRFAQAGQQFDALAQRYKDPPSVVFSKRCHTFMRRPPPDDWDGIFIAPGK